MLLPITDHLRKFAHSLVSFTNTVVTQLKRIRDALKVVVDKKQPIENIIQKEKGNISNYLRTLNQNVEIAKQFDKTKTFLSSKLPGLNMTVDALLKDTLKQYDLLLDKLKTPGDGKEILKTLDTIIQYCEAFMEARSKFYEPGKKE